MATVYDIIQGISQAAANAYDGSQYERYSYDGEEKKIGLKREEGDPILDSRVMDGFSVRFHGDKLIVGYQSEMLLKDLHNQKVEDEIEQMFSKIASFLRKEYKKITKNSIQLTSAGDATILLQNMSRIRTWVQASKIYKIGGLKGVEPVGAGTPEDRLDDSIKKWLAIGKETYPKATKPENVTRKEK